MPPIFKCNEQAKLLIIPPDLTINLDHYFYTTVSYVMVFDKINHSPA